MIGQETNGPGGLFKAFRTIPVILDIAHEMEELCPRSMARLTSPRSCRNGNGSSSASRVIFPKSSDSANVPIGMERGVA